MARQGLLVLWEARASTVEDQSEPQLDGEFIRPVLRIPGHLWEVQPSVGTHQPDHAFFAEEAAGIGQGRTPPAQSPTRCPRFSALRAASIDAAVTPHKLRHSFACMMLRNGADLNCLQRMLGHTRLDTTGVYLQATAEDLREAMASHPLGG